MAVKTAERIYTGRIWTHTQSSSNEDGVPSRCLASSPL